VNLYIQKLFVLRLSAETITSFI